MSNFEIEEQYLSSAKKQFQYYQALGEKTMEQLSDDHLFWSPNSESNSIATIVKHLWGNMMSRWTDFLTSDGEKDWRQREAEFENNWTSRSEILFKWKEGWEVLYQALDSINEQNFNTIIYIRNQGHTITDAINRQLCHYSYHIGQMVYLGKMIANEDWKSLSIPKGGTKSYNEKKFSEEKKRKHFTDES